jgi:hypothetical protein
MPRGRASAATAVIDRVSTPKAAAPAASEPTRAIPATRVNQPTPHTPPKAQPAAEVPKSKAPMMVGIAVVVLAVAGGGYFMMNKKGAEPLSQSIAPQSSAPAPADPAASLPPDVVVARKLEAVKDLADDPSTAQAAIDSLGRLDSLARLSSDSTLLHLRYRRSRALVAVGKIKAGCDSLNSIEGQLAQSRFKRASGDFRTTFCTP